MEVIAVVWRSGSENGMEVTASVPAHFPQEITRILIALPTLSHRDLAPAFEREA